MCDTINNPVLVYITRKLIRSCLSFGGAMEASFPRSGRPPHGRADSADGGGSPLPRLPRPPHPHPRTPPKHRAGHHSLAQCPILSLFACSSTLKLGAFSPHSQTQIQRALPLTEAGRPGVVPHRAPQRAGAGRGTRRNTTLACNSKILFLKVLFAMLSFGHAERAM